MSSASGGCPARNDDEAVRAPRLFALSNYINVALFVVGGLGLGIMLVMSLKAAFGILGALAVLGIAIAMLVLTAHFDEADEKKWQEIDKEIEQEYLEHQEEVCKKVEASFAERCSKAEEQLLREESEQLLKEHAADRACRRKELREALEAVAHEVSDADIDADALEKSRELVANKVAVALDMEKEEFTEGEDIDPSQAERLLKAAERGRAAADIAVHKRQMERLRRLRERLNDVTLPDTRHVAEEEEEVGQLAAKADSVSTPTSATDMVENLVYEVRAEAGEAVSDAMRRAQLRHRRSGAAAAAVDAGEPS